MVQNFVWFKSEDLPECFGRQAWAKTMQSPDCQILDQIETLLKKLSCLAFIGIVGKKGIILWLSAVRRLP